MLNLITLTCVAGIGSAFNMYRTGQITGRITWWDGVVTICGGGGLALVCGFVVARFMRRMLSVRRVLLFEDDRIGVVTWRGKIFTAKLPDNIEYVVRTGTDLTVALQIENRHFLVDSEQFLEKDRINEFLLPYYHTQAK